MEFSSPELLARIKSVDYPAEDGTDARMLLHAYIGCLSFAELCGAIYFTLSSGPSIRLALRSRLLRLLREGCAETELQILVELVEQTAKLSNINKAIRQVIDAFHSVVLDYLPLPTKHSMLNRWADRGSSGAMARWLKATKDNSDLFNAHVALAYWRKTGDSRAAKSLAYQASTDVLRHVLPELVKEGEAGWIIARAIIRVGWADEESWEKIFADYPATYLYLCAKTSRNVTDDDAFELVKRCPSRYALSGDRGLAIWAVGQMGKVAVIDRLRDELGAWHQHEVREYEQHHSQEPPK
jgi:hypothetical protein